jgi:hypothetical protein
MLFIVCQYIVIVIRCCDYDYFLRYPEFHDYQI